jgi:uncharacterized protein YwgA
MTRIKFLLALLDAAGKIKGSTRLQKEIFLAQNEANVRFGYNFEILHYGPYSSQIFSDIEKLEKQNLVKREVSLLTMPDGAEVKRVDYELTREGKRLAASLDINCSKLKEITSKYNDMPLWKLLKYVYESTWFKNWNKKTSLATDF